MLRELEIKNYKSIINDTISLGRVNVFIGENGSGKSNILEALMFASLSETYGTIDADLLNTNGIRVCKPSLMVSSFRSKKQKETIEINLKFDDSTFGYNIRPLDFENILTKWSHSIFSYIDIEGKFLKGTLSGITIKGANKKKNVSIQTEIPAKVEELLYSDSKFKEIFLETFQKKFTDDIHKIIKDRLEQKKSESFEDITNFIIYTLNTEALRGIPEFLKSKKGIYGETLDIIINELSNSEREELNQYLYTFRWVEEIFIDDKDELKQQGYKLNFSKSLLYFKDKFMMKSNNIFSSENSNEGVLHILFYLANIISNKQPRLFAIDNIETSLNPHLCQHLMFELTKLAKTHNKQLLITTHNPAILDGLDLFDDDVRLFEVFRTDEGYTKTRRIQQKPEIKNEMFKLSELWTRGYLGAISDNF